MGFASFLFLLQATLAKEKESEVREPALKKLLINTSSFVYCSIK